MKEQLQKIVLNLLAGLIFSGIIIVPILLVYALIIYGGYVGLGILILIVTYTLGGFIRSFGKNA